MVLGGVRTNDENAIGILNVRPVIRHGTTTEALRQTGDSGGVSYPCLVFDVG